jgi:hypothetical protein
MDEEQARGLTLLLLDETESGAGADRAPADAWSSSGASTSSSLPLTDGTRV